MKRVIVTIGAAMLAAGATVHLAGAAYAQPEPAAPRTADVGYVPTPYDVVDSMLALGAVNQEDVLYDLGSGDGRLPITAARRFRMKKAVGIDVDAARVAEAQANAKIGGVADKVSFRHEDLLKADFSEATVVTLNQLDSIGEKLRPRLLAQLKPGTRIVSRVVRLGDWPPQRSLEVDGGMIYFWTVPAPPPRK